MLTMCYTMHKFILAEVTAPSREQQYLSVWINIMQNDVKNLVHDIHSVV